MLSIFDIYKIGVGPSSSHTNGPMIAGFNFTQKIDAQLTQVERIP
ncbi:serine dehydratase beta chain, partial [Vibrio sp. 10N.222.51.A6]